MTDHHKKKSAPILHQNHGRPLTRRQLLSQGFIGFSAYTMAPTLMGLMASKASAMACGTTTAQNFIPFLIFDMAGGAALPGNFLVGSNTPNDLLANYDRLGWNPRRDAIDRRFGLPMATNISQIFRGITQTASADAQARLRMGSFCNFSRDDTSANQLSAIGMVTQIGYRGIFLAKGLGIVDSASGGNSEAVSSIPSMAPVFVRGVGDILRSVSFGTAFSDLSPRAITAMAQGSLNVSMDQLGRLANGPDVQQLSELARCGYEQNIAFTQGATGLDPRTDANFQDIYGIAQNTPDGDVAAISAAVVMNALKGNSGPGVLTVGGCDYHDGTQSSGDAKDLEMGLQIGRAVEAAHRLQKPLFFQLLTDGGVSADAGSREWTSDSGDKSMTVIGYYKPTGAPEQRPNVQVGRYTEGQGADRSTIIGADPARVAYAVFANYLQISGMAGQFETYAPGIFTNPEFDSVLIFS